MASNSYQNVVPKARVNIRLDLHTGGAQKKVELPLKLMVMGDYSNGREQRSLSERRNVNVNKLNFDSVLSEFSPRLSIAVANTLADEGNEAPVSHWPATTAWRAGPGGESSGGYPDSAAGGGMQR